jgi:hypothetical protein
MGTLQKTIPAYLYQQYFDDGDLQAFVAAYNDTTQRYINTFNQLNLPIYTGLSGDLLDWVGRGLYGYPRPTFGGVADVNVGPLNTYGPNDSVPLNSQKVIFGTPSPITTDDIYKRLLTWHFYKGDGKVFSIPWLKRRIKRFLIGTSGTSPLISNTNDISITFIAPKTPVITIASSPNGGYLKSAIENGSAELPFQYSFSVVLS